MPWLLIDGHNVIFHHPTLTQDYKRRPNTAIDYLISQAQHISDTRDWRTVLFFDGNFKSRGISCSRSCKLEIIFADSYLTADALIEKLCQKIPPSQDIFVVTADVALTQSIASSRVHVFTPDWFFQECKAARETLQDSLRRINRKARWERH